MYEYCILKISPPGGLIFFMQFGGKMWKEEPAIGENLKEKGRKITSEGKTGVNRVNKYIRGKKWCMRGQSLCFSGGVKSSILEPASE
jgi:hypothetical protein